MCSFHTKKNGQQYFKQFQDILLNIEATDYKRELQVARTMGKAVIYETAGITIMTICPIKRTTVFM